jgi:hypothetical protein
VSRLLFLVLWAGVALAVLCVQDANDRARIRTWAEDQSLRISALHRVWFALDRFFLVGRRHVFSIEAVDHAGILRSGMVRVMPYTHEIAVKWTGVVGP